MAANVLAPLANLNNALLSTQVHPSLFPYPLLSTFHAARISLVYRALSKRARQAAEQQLGREIKTTWAYDIAGFLVMVSRIASLVAPTHPHS